MNRRMKTYKSILFLFIIFFTWLPNYNAYANDFYKEFTNAQEAIEWGKRQSGNYLFSAEQRQLFKEYSYNSRPFNSNLRKGIPFSELSVEEQKRILTLDKAVVYPLVTENIIVYRYANIDFLERIGYSKKEIEENIVGNYFQTVLPTAIEYIQNTGAVGKIYQEPGFLSTTLVKNSVFTHRPIELRIKVRRLKNATYIGYPGMSYYPQELELLFPREEQLRIDSVSFSPNNKIHVEAQLLGPYFLRDGQVLEYEKYILPD